jgi:hypothetical protein
MPALVLGGALATLLRRPQRSPVAVTIPAASLRRSGSKMRSTAEILESMIPREHRSTEVTKKRADPPLTNVRERMQDRLAWEGSSNQRSIISIMTS